MRHSKQRHKLGVKSAHRLALMANLATALLKHGKIQTTLAKAKALRPFVEKIITLACKAAATEDKAKKLHYRRQAIARVRDVKTVALLFDEKVEEFTNRPGGYTRIYKLVPRRGDAASMALIELIDASDEGYKSKRKRPKKVRKGGPAPRAKKLEPAVSKPADQKEKEASGQEESQEQAEAGDDVATKAS